MCDNMMEAIDLFVQNKSIHEITTFLLHHIMQTAKCDYGLIGETKYTDSRVYSRYHAVLGFPDDSVYMTRIRKDKYIDFMQPSTLHAKVYETGEKVICNDVLKHRFSYCLEWYSSLISISTYCSSAPQGHLLTSITY